MTRRLALAAVAGLAAPASADTRVAPTSADRAPDPAAVEAGDANLEPVGERSGITFSIALGGALTLGFGMEDATGRGGAATIRVGRVATKQTLITLELTGSALFHGAAMGATAQNNITTLEVGAQYYARSRLWLRLGTGYGAYQGRQVLRDPATGARGDVRLHGVAGTFGVGIEFVRIKRFAFQLEMFSTGMINRDGMLASSGLLLGASVD